MARQIQVRIQPPGTTFTFEISEKLFTFIQTELGGKDFFRQALRSAKQAALGQFRNETVGALTLTAIAARDTAVDAAIAVEDTDLGDVVDL